MESNTFDLANPAGRVAYVERNLHCALALWQQRTESHNPAENRLAAEGHSLLTALSLAFNFSDLWPMIYPLLDRVALHFERVGPWDRWQTILQQGINQAQAQQQWGQVAELCALSARLANRRGHYADVVTFYRRAARLARDQADLFTEGRACTNLGYHFIELGQWWRGEVLCYRAMACFDQINNDYGRAHTANHFGLLYTRQQRWAKAETHLIQACTLWELADNMADLVHSLLNLGLLYAEKNALPESLNQLQKALELAESLADPILLGKVYNNLACTYRFQGNLAEAEAFAFKAKACFQTVSHIWGLTEVNHNLGLIYCVGQKQHQAETHLTKAIQTWQHLGNKFREQQVRKDLAESINL